MQTYPFHFSGAMRSLVLAVPATFVQYETGAGTGGSNKIRCRSSGGGEVILRPGQGYQLPIGAASDNWTFSPFDADVLSGSVVLGLGVFSDSNTNTTVTLEGAIRVANPITDPVFVTVPDGVVVKNDNASRVPVSVDPGQIVRVNVEGVVSTSQGTIVYQKSYSKNDQLNVSDAVVLPSQNVAGVIVSRTIIQPPFGGSVSLLACTPSQVGTGLLGGDLIAYGQQSGVVMPPVVESVQVMIPPGRGLYFACDSGSTGLRSVLYTVL